MHARARPAGGGPTLGHGTTASTCPSARAIAIRSITAFSARFGLISTGRRYGWPDETHQFATELDPAQPGVSMLSAQPIEELVAAAADWLEREMRRPIVETSGTGWTGAVWLPDFGVPTPGKTLSLVASDRPTLGRRTASCQ